MNQIATLIQIPERQHIASPLPEVPPWWGFGLVRPIHAVKVELEIGPNTVDCPKNGDDGEHANHHAAVAPPVACACGCGASSGSGVSIKSFSCSSHPGLPRADFPQSFHHGRAGLVTSGQGPFQNPVAMGGVPDQGGLGDADEVPILPEQVRKHSRAVARASLSPFSPWLSTCRSRDTFPPRTS